MGLIYVSDGGGDTIVTEDQAREWFEHRFGRAPRIIKYQPQPGGWGIWVMGPVGSDEMPRVDAHNDAASEWNEKQ